jgi:hypothetical protein
MADTNQIWVGDLIKRNITDYRKDFFTEVTPENWTWQYQDASHAVYRVWHYNASRTIPK